MSGDLHARLRARRGGWSVDADLHAPVGTVTLLTGPSGAGKTTLLRAIAGLERLEGEVRLGSETWQGPRAWTAPHRRKVGLVFQHGALFGHLSVSGNLAFAARRSGASAQEVQEAVSRFGLGDLQRRGVTDLSGGERRRVALARALLSRPRLLLLDEPLAGLDPDAKAALAPVLREAIAATEASVLWVAHEPSDAPLTPGRRLHLQNGKVHEETGVDRSGVGP